MNEQRASRTSTNSNGFTIVELLIVIVVIAILAAITIVAYTGIQERARASTVQNDVAQAVRQIEINKTTAGTDTYPTTLPSTVTASEGVQLTYSYDPVINRYCVTATNNGISYYASTSKPSANEGTCSDNSRIVGWWPFNGNAQDISEVGHDANVIGAILSTGQSGVADTAYYFDGVDDSVRPMSELPEADDLFATTGVSWTTTAWFKYEPRTGDADIVLGRGGGTGTSATYGLFIEGGGLRAVLRGNTTLIQSSIDDQWHFVAVTWDGTTARGYFDANSPVTLGVNSAGLQNTNFTVGATNNGSNNASTRSFLGSIDDVRVYSRAISADELTFMYEQGAE